MKSSKLTRASKPPPTRLACPDCGVILASKYEAKNHSARLAHSPARPLPERTPR